MSSTVKIADLSVFNTLVEQKTFLSTVILNTDLSDLFLSCCTEVALLSVSRTCRIAHETVKEYMRRAFNINPILSSFITSPLSFRLLQARTGALISGSVALQFFDRSYSSEADLDVYVPLLLCMEATMFFVVNGYSPKLYRGHNLSPGTGIC